MPPTDTAPADQALRLAYARYTAALPAGDRRELVTSRLALCLALLETGWCAPDAVQEQMRRDEKTLRRLNDVEEQHTLDLLGAPTQPWHEIRWLTSPAFAV